MRIIQFIWCMLVGHKKETFPGYHGENWDENGYKPYFFAEIYLETDPHPSPKVIDPKNILEIRPLPEVVAHVESCSRCRMVYWKPVSMEKKQ